MTPTLDRDPTAATDWTVWGTEARLVVTDPRILEPAREAVCAYLDAVDRACSRFRSDSEISGLAELPHPAGSPSPARAGREVGISALLAEYLRAALAVAKDTRGDVDPTVGAALVQLGYDRDYALIAGTDTVAPVQVVFTPPTDWSMITLTERTVTVPPGVLLAPASGWQILVQDGPGEPSCRISLPQGAAMATSSTLRRRWMRGGRLVHHIVDPRTGAAAESVWRTVSVAAESCVAANAAATASIVRGREALGALRRAGLPARLVDRDGRITTLGSWPADR